jgi:predicted membrane channel-forming protein YqfA (hemolysin III family)
VYRDIYPLATFTQAPRDLSDGWILWAEIIILALVAVLLPLVEPRQYIPVDLLVYVMFGVYWKSFN